MTKTEYALIALMAASSLRALLLYGCSELDQA
jgi:hypothetical protein